MLPCLELLGRRSEFEVDAILCLGGRNAHPSKRVKMCAITSHFPVSLAAVLKA